MTDPGGVRKGAVSPLSKELPVQDISTGQIPTSGATTEANTYVPSLLRSDNSTPQAYVPSPPLSGIEKVARYMASLTGDHRQSITEFIQATKEPVSVAIHTLQECDWDLIEAVSRFGNDDDTQEDWEEETHAPPAPLTRQRHYSDMRMAPREPIKGQHWRMSPAVLRRQVLQRLAFQNGRDWPQSPRAVIQEPVTFQFSPSSPKTYTIPMFISPYEDKMWYTGFMKP